MEKLKISLKYWLLGRNYLQAVKALDLAEKYHTGTRKNGDPEIIHQLTIAQFLRVFAAGNQLLRPEQTLCAALLHDTCEDTSISFEEIDRLFGIEIGNAVQFLTKKYRNRKFDNNIYYDRVSSDPISSVVKGADRIHNIQSMVGVFSVEKQKEYIEETRLFTLPMLKKARKSFPEQEPVYENIKLILKSQISLIEEIHKSSDLNKNNHE